MLQDAIARLNNLLPQQFGCHLGVAEDSCPFAEAEVCGDHHTGPLVMLAQQVEEQRFA